MGHVTRNVTFAAGWHAEQLRDPHQRAGIDHRLRRDSEQLRFRAKHPLGHGEPTSLRVDHRHNTGRATPARHPLKVASMERMKRIANHDQTRGILSGAV